MGVLNFPGSLHCQNGVEFDILSLEADIELQQELNEASFQNINLSNSELNRSSSKRKRTKSVNGKCYDFRECGVDARRRGAKHQRRKQNLADLLDTAQNNNAEVDENDWYCEEHLTLFTELFLDEKKMNAWECFVNMPEEKQKEYLEQKTGIKRTSEKSGHKDTEMMSEVARDLENGQGFHMIDEKIRDMLRTKKLASLGLLECYENDMRSCAGEAFPSIVILNLDSGFDRLLVYAICQYMKLSSSTIRLKDNTAIIEIELPTSSEDWRPPVIKLTDYLKRMRKNR